MVRNKKIIPKVKKQIADYAVRDLRCILNMTTMDLALSVNEFIPIRQVKLDMVTERPNHLPFSTARHSRKIGEILVLNEWVQDKVYLAIEDMRDQILGFKLHVILSLKIDGKRNLARKNVTVIEEVKMLKSN